MSVLSVWSPRRREGDRSSLVHDRGDELHIVPEFTCVLESMSCPEDLGISLSVQGCYLCPTSFAYLMRLSCLKGPVWEAACRLCVT